MEGWARVGRVGCASIGVGWAGAAMNYPPPPQDRCSGAGWGVERGGNDESMPPDNAKGVGGWGHAIGQGQDNRHRLRQVQGHCSDVRCILIGRSVVVGVWEVEPHGEQHHVVPDAAHVHQLLSQPHLLCVPLQVSTARVLSKY